MDKLDEWLGRVKGTSNKEPVETKSSSPKTKNSKPAAHKAKSGNNKAKNRSQSGRSNTSRSNRAPLAKKPAGKRKEHQILKGKLKIIPLGGLDEVGKNMMALEYEDEIIIIDMGFQFPDEDLFGIDYVIPDISYLEENKKRIKAVILTHGHLDHIGGIPYMLPKLDFPPIYGTPLTIGLVEHRLKEFKQEKLAKLHKVSSDDKLKFGNFAISFFRVAHSIPDCVSIVMDTPVGRVVHTGDFKFDETPARNMKPAEVSKMEQVGKDGVLALLCESTNSMKPGHTISEKEVGEALDRAVGQADGRVILASFSSQIGRIQQVIDAAHKHGRKIYVSGRSMQNNIENATKLGYLYIPKGCIADIRKYDEKSTPAKQTLLLTTGSQGEPMSALTRIARGEHSHVRVTKGDTIIFSSSPIVGNEKAIYRVINSLCKIGADVIHNQIMDVHTSGHGKQEELARMINYMKPKYLVPIHGEYYMRQGLGHLAARECGIPTNRTILLENGKILVVEKGEKLTIAKETVETKYVLIDGHGEGTVDSNVITDREVMSQNGCLTVLVYVNKKTRKITRDPDVISRGFIYMHELDQVTKEVSQVAVDAYNKLMKKDRKADRHSMKRYIKQSIDRFAYDRLQRKPLIVPLIIES